MDINEPVIKDNYYVKYVINGTGAYGRFSDWTVTTPEETYTNSGYQTRSWNQTYGPVKKGFKCDVQVGNYIWEAPIIEIHVSKNEEPFALKVTKTGKTASPMRISAAAARPRTPRLSSSSAYIKTGIAFVSFNSPKRKAAHFL